MKIEYVESNKKYPKLCEIPAGTAFAPIDSLEVYIRLDRDGMSDVFTDDYNILRRNTLNIQNAIDEWNDYTDIIAVAHLGSGTLAFMNRERRVIPLDCKLVVEG